MAGGNPLTDIRDHSEQSASRQGILSGSPGRSASGTSSGPSTGDAVNGPLTWQKRPDAEQLERLYPSSALDAGVSGSAEMECVIGQSGAMTQCQIIGEAPSGHGFGRAGLRAMALYSVGAQQGAQNVGALVRQTLVWTAPDPDPAQGAVPNPTPAALDQTLSTPAQAQPTAPRLLRGPSASRVSQAYPESAAKVRVQSAAGYSRQIDGYAKLRCRVLVSGRLDQCTIMDESPAGYGFGDAARSLAAEFLFQPATIDGQPAEGWAEFPVVWHGNQ